MSPVDLNRNRSSMLQAFEEVSNPKNDTDWALFSYEGQTDVLKLVSKGDGGIEELLDELNSGKIMYAYCRVKDPNTELPKFVLINWQGEGVPEIKKGSCAYHISDVARLLKGAHVTITARTEDDVDADDILKKVASSSGCNYSVHKEKPQPGVNAPSGPVGSVYKKTLPHHELKTNVRDKFWQQQQEEEQTRQNELSQRAMTEKKKIDEETKEREGRETTERDTKERERMKKVYEMKIAEKRANAANDSEQKQKWEKQQLDAMKDDEERRKRADRLRKERASEAQSLVSQRNANPRAMFEHQTSQFDEPTSPTKSAPPPPRKLKHGFMDNEPTSQFDQPKQPIQVPREEPPSPVESRPMQPPVQRELPKIPDPEPEPEPEPEPKRVSLPPEPASPVSAPPASHPPTRNLLAENLPKRPDSDDEQEDQDWDAKANEPTGEDFSMPATVMPSVPQPQVEMPDETYDDVRVDQQETEELYDDVRADEPAPVTGDNKGVVARALYDYQATEENEISFDPGDIITEVDQIDPGWWIGTAPDGSKGMFPSNYVELI